VRLRVQVSAEGRTLEVTLQSSSGHQRLDEAAARAVRKWKFVPARRGDTAVAAWVVVPIAFRLRN
jgi:periplasmic protein TonB